MSSLRIHYVQHVPYEGPGFFEAWRKAEGFQATYTRLFAKEKLPSIHQFDWLVVLGGPMSVFDDLQFEWLINEKQFIQEAILNGKKVIGVCLGAQLIAHVLGAKVYPNVQEETGWFPVYLNKGSVEWLDFQGALNVFHWHGDTFELPEGVRHVFRSRACPNQMFTYEDRVIGIQFHPEVMMDTIEEMMDYYNSNDVSSLFVQSKEEIIANANHCLQMNNLLAQILNRLADIQ